MSDTERDRDGRMPERTGSLTTAQLAGAASDGAREVAAEPRSFDADDSRRDTPLLATNEVSDLRERWTTVQGGFVDEPRRAVEDADALVAQTMKRLAEMFADERAKLESQWDRGDQVSTEELRIALQRYRSFFDRLLSF
jgi:hypothetical protein